MKQQIVEKTQKAVKEYLGFDTGDYINEGEDEKIAEKIKDLYEKKELLLKEKIKYSEETAKLYQQPLIDCQKSLEIEKEIGEDLNKENKKLKKEIIILEGIKSGIETAIDTIEKLETQIKGYEKTFSVQEKMIEDLKKEIKSLQGKCSNNIASRTNEEIFKEAWKRIKIVFTGK